MTQSEQKNILAINFGGIGDEIFFLPTLLSLKKEFPNSKITLALEPRSKSVKDLTNITNNTSEEDNLINNNRCNLFLLLYSIYVW